MTNTKKLSIIIVNYNSWSVLKDCLESIQSTCGQIEHEVIIVDNNSRDGSVAYVREMYPSVSLITSTTNDGFPIANNRALAIAGGDYVLFLNPDTLVRNCAVQIMIDYLAIHPETVAIGPKIVNADGSLCKVAARRFPSLWAEFCALFLLDRIFARSNIFNRQFYPLMDRNLLQQVECLVGAAMLMRRVDVQSLGGFDESLPLYLDDIDLCRRLHAVGDIVYLPEAEILHHHNVSGSTCQPGAIIDLSLQARYLFLRRYCRSFHGALYILLVLVRSLMQMALVYPAYALLKPSKVRFVGLQALAMCRWAFSSKSAVRVLQ